MKEGDDSRVSLAPATIGRERGKRPEILVVEDDDALRLAVADVLRGEGFSVVEATNGSAALDYLLGGRTTPGLILLDLTMPIMSGREMIRVLQGYVRFSMIPVLIMTSEVPLAVSPEEGTVGRLQKPFSSDQLLAHVRQYVRPTPVDE
jgi:CheY-like chemotaxis protein